MAGCNTGRNIQKYKGSGGTASTLQEALENSNVATIDINLISGAKFRGDGSALTGISGSGGAVGNLQQVTNQDNQTTNSIIITNTGTSLTTSGTIISSGNITAPSFIGSGTSLTGIALAIDTSSNAARVSVLETDLTSNVSRVSGLETDLTSNASRVSVLETDLTSNVARVGVLETDLASNSTRIGTVSTDLASNSTRIGTVSTDLASNSTRIGTVSTDLASNSGRITTVEIDLASNAGRITTVETDLASNSTRITNLQNSTIISNSSGITNAFETGDLIYASGQNTLSNLSIGSTSQVLTVSGGGIPVWAAPSGGGGGGYWTQPSGTTIIHYNTGNVGIGTSSPAYPLDITGNMNVTGGLRANGSTGSSGQVLTSSGGGVMSWSTITSSGLSPWTTSGSNVYISSGNVGIGTTTPAYPLDVNGTVNATSFRGDGTNLTGVTASSITTEASRTISISKISVLPATWKR